MPESVPRPWVLRHDYSSIDHDMLSRHKLRHTLFERCSGFGVLQTVPPPPLLVVILNVYAGQETLQPY